MRLRGFTVLVVVVLLGAWVSGCRSSKRVDRPGGGAFIPLSVEAARRAGLSPSEAGEAAGLYTAKCARCHKFYDPNPYSDAEWHSWMRKMSRKAHLSAGQNELLSRYLNAFRREPFQPKRKGAAQ